MGWTRKDLLTMRELDAGEIVLLVDTAASLQEIATREIKKALLELLTIRENKGHFAGLHIAIGGEITTSRVARSNIHGMRKLGMTVTVAGPPTLIPPFVQELGVKVANRLEDAIRDVDVIMMLRLQHERMRAGLVPSVREYSRYSGLTLDQRGRHAHPDVH